MIRMSKPALGLCRGSVCAGARIRDFSHLYMTALNAPRRDLHIPLLERQHYGTNHSLAATAAGKKKRVVFSLHLGVEFRARRHEGFYHEVLPGVTRRVEEGPHGVFIPRIQVAPVFDEFLAEF